MRRRRGEMTRTSFHYRGYGTSGVIGLAMVPTQGRGRTGPPHPYHQEHLMNAEERAHCLIDRRWSCGLLGMRRRRDSVGIWHRQTARIVWVACQTACCRANKVARVHWTVRVDVSGRTPSAGEPGGEAGPPHLCFDFSPPPPVETPERSLLRAASGAIIRLLFLASTRARCSCLVAGRRARVF